MIQKVNVTVIERKFTEEECISNGGHFWRYWSANTPVDKNFNADYSCGSFAVYYPNGEPVAYCDRDGEKIRDLTREEQLKWLKQQKERER